MVRERPSTSGEFRSYLRDLRRLILIVSNCIVLLTTSIGQNGAFVVRSIEETHHHFLQEIQSYFPVEFFARIDELVIFVRFPVMARYSLC